MAKDEKTNLHWNFWKKYEINQDLLKEYCKFYKISTQLKDKDELKLIKFSVK